MSVAFVILAHENFHRVAQLTNALVAAGARVALHVDAEVDEAALVTLGQAVSDPSVAFVPRVHCEWGKFSLVEAALAGAELALTRWPDAGHVCLLSGSCLPVKPLEAFLDHLRAAPETDFIESVPVRSETWVKSGLSEERFTLYFPFSWHHHRWYFDRFVALQRRLGIRRRLPEGIEPHLGAQWWCLSRATLSAILNDPMKPVFDRYFRSTWIPDESYFQTLARRHSRELVSKPVTYHRFDAAGRPYLFYDDHAEYLAGLDAFFARKAWHGAEGLYRRFLGGEPVAPRPGLDALLDAAERRSIEGRPGLLMAGRFPGRDWKALYVTAAPYAVFFGFSRQFPGLADWLGQGAQAVCHGRVFCPDRVEFAGGARHLPGNLTAEPNLRDYDQVQYLMNLIRSDAGRFQGFLLEPEEAEWIVPFLAGDPNARVFVLSDIWLFDAWRERQQGGRLTASDIARLKQRETAIAAPLLSPSAACQVSQISLREVLERPAGLASLIGRETPFTPQGAPQSAPLPEGFVDFLNDLEHMAPD